MIEKEHDLWWAKYSPTTLEGYIGNELFREDLEKWIAEGTIPNMILSGGAGTGKTTAAKLITLNIECDSLYVNASDENGIDTIREKVKSFASAASFAPIKICVLDESDFLTPNAQAALRNIIETFSLNTRFVFTCNYLEKIIDPIKSRLDQYQLNPPSKQELANKCAEILKKENITYTPENIATLVKKTYPDTRQCLIKLQSNSVNGELRLIDLSDSVSKAGETIVALLAKKDPKSFNKIRQSVEDANVRDYNELYRILFDNIDKFSTNVAIPWYISESQYKSTTAPDKTISFMGLISRILNDK